MPCVPLVELRGGTNQNSLDRGFILHPSAFILAFRLASNDLLDAGLDYFLYSLPILSTQPQGDIHNEVAYGRAQVRFPAVARARTEIGRGEVLLSEGGRSEIAAPALSVCIGPEAGALPTVNASPHRAE